MRAGTSLAEALNWDWLLKPMGTAYLVLGALKLHGILSPDELTLDFLSASNPVIFMLSNRAVLALAAIAEMVVGWYVVRDRPRVTQATALLWLAGASLAYKVALVIVNYQGPCGCLLGINRFVPVSSGTQRSVADGILVLTCVICISLLVTSRLSRRSASESPGGAAPNPPGMPGS